MQIMHAEDRVLASWEHELLGDILAKHWDGEFRDRIRDTHDDPQYWTAADIRRVGYITTPDLIAQHLDNL